MPINIFCCYAREDEALLDKLKDHLTLLRQQYLIRFYAELNLSRGTAWEPQIVSHLMCHLNTMCCFPPLTHDDFLDIKNKRMSNRLSKCLIHVSIELTIAYLKDWYEEANRRVILCMNDWYMYQSS